MKIGIFDSGLGGLVIARSIMQKLPRYNYVYLGDTKNLPYGEKSQRQIFSLTKKGVNFLFSKNCRIVVIACNTASASALRKLQQNWLQKKYPGRKILGVIVPTLEVASKISRASKIGVIGTTATINSHVYKKELKKLRQNAAILEMPTPNLVPLIESGAMPEAEKLLRFHLARLKANKINVLVLACTHYPFLKNAARKLLGKQVTVVSQDELLPAKLANYLRRHKEISARLAKNKKREFFVTQQNKKFGIVAKKLFGTNIRMQKVKI